MIPLYDDNPTKRTPVVTIAFMAINAAVFLLMAQTGKMFNKVVYMYGAIPAEITNSVDIFPYIEVPVQATMISSMFMHAGFLHLAGNMLYLWIFGNNVEDIMGPVRFILFYVISGLGAVAFYIVQNTDSTTPLVGASGAVSGILAAYLLSFPRARVYTFFWFIIFIRIIPLPAWVVIGVWFLLQISNLGTGGTTAWGAHVGGFLTGLVLLPFFRKKGLYGPWSKWRGT